MNDKSVTGGVVVRTAEKTNRPGRVIDVVACHGDKEIEVFELSPDQARDLAANLQSVADKIENGEQ